ncbi:MAG: alkylhydroperoxidase-related (seleno)protein [Defluviicoccus sp.]|nr:alkylhydroperoxidase-related (seleno)protein [Defluviicoccus sp.]
MSGIEYDTPYHVRESLVAAQRLAWRRIAEPGAWLDGERRVAVAGEVRAAGDCALCRERKQAVSPFAVAGEHAASGPLGAAEVELIHRLTSDPGRLRRSWAEGILAAGVSEEVYVEIVGIVCMVMIVDTFRRALGLPQFDLPAPVAGTQSGYRAPGARRHDAWISLVQPDDVVESDGDLYGAAASPVVKALSLVPEAKRAYWDLAEEHYLPGSEMTDFATGARAIDRMQMELVAGRVSALHQCVY